MKIRGNTVGTPIKPKKVLVKCENLTEEEKAQVRENLGITDGFSPTVTVEETAEGATITITDKNGTTTAVVAAGLTNEDEQRIIDSAIQAAQNKHAFEGGKVHFYDPMYFVDNCRLGHLKEGDFYVMDYDYEYSEDISFKLGEIVRVEADREWVSVGFFPFEEVVSPTATVEETAEGATITITDKNGTTTATVNLTDEKTIQKLADAVFATLSDGDEVAY